MNMLQAMKPSHRPSAHSGHFDWSNTDVTLKGNYTLNNIFCTVHIFTYVLLAYDTFILSIRTSYVCCCCQFESSVIISTVILNKTNN